MIRRFLLVISAMLICNVAFSQIQEDVWIWPDDHTQDMQIRLETGIKAGGGMSFASKPLLYNCDFHGSLAYQLGIAANAHLGYRSKHNPEIISRFGLEFEALWGVKNIKTDWGKISMHCIEIPILLQFHLSSSLFLEAGPTLVKMITASPDYLQSGAIAIDVSNMKANDVMLSMGLGYRTPAHLAFGIRFNKGLSPLAGNLDSKTSTVLFSISYLFPIIK